MPYTRYLRDVPCTVWCIYLQIKQDIYTRYLHTWSYLCALTRGEAQQGAVEECAGGVGAAHQQPVARVPAQPANLHQRHESWHHYSWHHDIMTSWHHYSWHMTHVTWKLRWSGTQFLTVSSASVPSSSSRPKLIWQLLILDTEAVITTLRRVIITPQKSCPIDCILHPTVGVSGAWLVTGQ